MPTPIEDIINASEEWVARALTPTASMEQREALRNRFEMRAEGYGRPKLTQLEHDALRELHLFSEMILAGELVVVGEKPPKYAADLFQYVMCKKARWPADRFPVEYPDWPR